MQSPDGESIFGPGKPFALLVYLDTLANRRAGREHLLSLLWADQEPVAARHSLRQMIWHIRQRLGTNVVSTVQDDVSLTVPMMSDRTAFLAAIDAGRFDEAVRIYRGDFLTDLAVAGGIAFEHWADAERQHLRVLFRRTAEAVARKELKHGQFRRARDLARRVRDADPLDEHGWRLLIEICLTQGDPVTASAEIDRLVQTLEIENRIPEPATAALLRRARGIPEIEDDANSRQLVAELIGREREFASLLTAFECARRGSPQVRVVEAPAGIGKTRLLRDFGRRLTAAGATVVYVRAHPGDRDIPWLYACELVRGLAQQAGAAGVSPASAAILVAMEPSLSAWFKATTDRSTGDERSRRRVAAMVDLVQSVSDDHPVVLLLDDLHWADAPSREAIEQLGRRLTREHLLLVGASRPGHPVRAGHGSIDHLFPLTVEQIEALLASLGRLPEEPWAAELGSELHAATMGSPLLALETLQLAIETRRLQLIGGRWSCTASEELAEILEVGSAMVRRVRQLDPDKSRLLLLLAIAGAPLPTSTMTNASDREEEYVTVALQDLERRGLATHLGDRWSVGHDEIGFQLESDSSPEERLAAHAALGRSLTAEATDPVALRAGARHLNAAGLDRELSDATARWTRHLRNRGDRRPVRALVSELLGAHVADEKLNKVVKGLPWNVRFRFFRTVPLAAVVTVLLTAVFAMVLRPANEPSVLLGVWNSEPDGGFRLYARELTRDDLSAGFFDITSLERTNHVSPDRPDGLIRPGAPGVLAGTKTYADSGGEDLILVSDGGQKMMRLTFQPGDEYVGSWSPDGRYLANMTDRWTNRSRSDLMILDPDVPDSVVARLTSEPDARDKTPMWSPDGTRIAFQRGYLGARDSDACVVSVDGHDLRCPVVNHPGSSVVGWASPVELMIAAPDTTGASRILVVDVRTGEHRVVADGQALGLTRATGWVPCFCRRKVTEPYQTLLIPVGEPERAIRLQGTELPPDVWLFDAGNGMDYLDRVRIIGPDHPIALDAPFRLDLRGWDAKGTPLEPLAVRWLSGDTLVVTVDSLGEVRPRRQGTVVIHATAGGWRGDSIELRVGPPEVSIELVEDWQSALDERWVAFGQPQPFIQSSERGQVLVPNGDSTFPSGIYLRELLPVDQGVGFDIEVSAQITQVVWQNITFLVVSHQATDRDSWDHALGFLPIGQMNWRACQLKYPAQENARGAESLVFAGGLSRIVGAPPGMRTGAWTRLRIQVFPDGRCGLAVNGIPRVLHDARVSLGDSATIMIMSYEHNTTFKVGRIEIWRGVRGDVDWNAVEGR